jgi:hypothetical protein
VAAAGFAGGLFAYETPARDGAPPEDVRAAVPDSSTSAASSSPATESASAPPTSAVPSPSVSTSAAPSSSPSPSPSSASPSPTAPAEPSRSPSGTAGDGAADSGGEADEDARSGPVLRRGDQGPEVTELQQRLHRLYLYNGPVDGDFSSQVEDALRSYQWSRGVGTDNLGVYDQETRTALERETPEP